eukprot:CAMPEP_0172535502 /NCGR_PEP_ID=MMETSP1067-20121228/7482_1 /TAXON_ID=265564 ORGANISM="Thalassiosira punctigera, Strain Tpunct2005C2" /NCGR_SAMPLE_ID=MMETSP1067 /ASSEMBLY_ACC=CAM_ASM_000444 /LENGTH=508 /DNA_ID=CAMNT_0013320439 /DNA_START=140 /DNA_END=1666 /DNA_ORIENTATION=-
MEDRHTVSEPRPVESIGRDGNLPSWEVDVLRDDTVIVDTFLLNNSVLPPRTNKRGKVVWRLPDTTDKLPSFGTDDRRRILDIFKDRKKKRKQEKKKRNLSPSQNEDPGTPGKCERRSSVSTSPGGGEIGAEKYERHDSGSKSSVQSNAVALKPKIKGKENGKSLENLSKESEGRGRTESGEGQKPKKKDNQPERGRGAKRESSNNSQHPQSFAPSTPQPPGLGLSPVQAPKGTDSSTASASGKIQSQSHSTQLHPHTPSTPDPSRMSIDDSQEISTPPQPQPTHERPIMSFQTSFTEPPPPDALFVTVPRNERPESLPGQPESSLAVPAARHFISRYYAHFDGSLHGAQIVDLIRYYTPKAQKSVSIGGAHSVVTGRRDISAQILSLAGAAFVVRGVVAQDTADGKGVHILVTGTARTGLNGAAGGVVASFAHSVSLVPMHGIPYLNVNHGVDGICPSLLEALEVGFPFQIHNDALALLSGDAGPVTTAPVPQPVQMQQLPPPPPGLF